MKWNRLSLIATTGLLSFLILRMIDAQPSQVKSADSQRENPYDRQVNEQIEKLKDPFSRRAFRRRLVTGYSSRLFRLHGARASSEGQVARSPA